MIKKAYAYMKKLIAHGYEFPDAHAKACDLYDLTDLQADKLRRMYDDEENPTYNGLVLGLQQVSY